MSGTLDAAEALTAWQAACLRGLFATCVAMGTGFEASAWQWPAGRGDFDSAASGAASVAARSRQHTPPHSAAVRKSCAENRIAMNRFAVCIAGD
jgi:hypothetical protein